MFLLSLGTGADVATVAAASVVTSLIVGIVIGALLRHFLPQFRKKHLKSSKADNYEHPDFNRTSKSNEVDTSGEEQYVEFRIRDD